MKFEVSRSKGFEGMAQSPDGKFLYALLEGPLWVEATNSFESKDGKTYLRILEFDVDKEEFTGKSWKYPLEPPGNAIGDFNLIDATTRPDHRARRQRGRSGAGLPQGAPKPDCFNVPAKFKRIYKIDFAQADADGFVKKVGYIDLMDIDDPNKLARQGGQGRQAHLPVLHHRECRRRRRRPHHRRQRQQPALLVGPRARQVGRQRDDHPQGDRPAEGEVARCG